MDTALVGGERGCHRGFVARMCLFLPLPLVWLAWANAAQSDHLGLWALLCATRCVGM